MSGEVLRPVNLLSAQGLRRIIGDMVKNFSGFSPLGTVIVSLLGFSFAEKSGLIPLEAMAFHQRRVGHHRR